MRKGEIACNKQFLLFSQCFLSYKVLIFHFKCALKCRLQFCFSLDKCKFESGNDLTLDIYENTKHMVLDLSLLKVNGL